MLTLTHCQRITMIVYTRINYNLLMHYTVFTRQSYRWQGVGEGRGQKDVSLPSSLALFPLPPCLPPSVSACFLSSFPCKAWQRGR